MPKGRKFKTKQELIDAVISQRSSRKSFGFGSSDSLQSDLDIIENLTDGEFENASGFVETTYSELVNDINTSSLSKGVWYGFDYQTIHVIEGSQLQGNPQVYPLNTQSVRYDNGSGSLANFTPEVEHIYVLALSENTIHVEAVSATHPDDIIHYNYALDSILINNVKEDPADDDEIYFSRPGFITYRKDTINNIEAGFDFRNALVRRFHFDWAYRVEGATTTDFRTNYIQDDLLNIDEISSIGYSFDAAFNGVTNTGQTNTIDNPVDPADANPDSNFPNLSPYYKDSNKFKVGGFEGRILDPTIHYRDFKVLTPVNDTGFDQAGTFQNISIGVNSVPITSGSGTGTSFNNLAARGYLDKISNVLIRANEVFGVKIGNNNKGVTLNAQSFTSINIGDSNYNVYIGDTSIDLSDSTNDYIDVYKTYLQSHSDQITIGNRNTDIAITEHSRDIEIGNDNNEFWNLQGSSNIKIGNRNNNIYNFYSFHLNIGDQNTDIYLSNASNTSIKDHNTGVWLNRTGYNRMSSLLEIGSLNTTIRLDMSGGKIGDSCNNIWSRFGGLHVENNCDYILVYQGFGDIKTNSSRIFIKDGSNSIGEGCTNINIEGTYNTIGKNCSNLLLITNTSFNTVGSENTHLYILGGGHNTIGKGGSYNFIRNASSLNNVLGEGCEENFIESSANNILGDYCTHNIIGRLALKFRHVIDDFDQYIYISSPGSAGNLSAIQVDLPDDASVTESALTKYKSEGNRVGNNCTYNIFANGASNNVLGDDVSNVALGVTSNTTVSGITYDHMWGSAKNYTTINAISETGLPKCSGNIIKDGLQGVRLTPTTAKVILNITTGGVGEGESFTINGTTYTEPTDFNATQDPTADATAIAGIDYSADTTIVSATAVGDSVEFVFNQSYSFSAAITNSTIVEKSGNNNQIDAPIDSSNIVSGSAFKFLNTGLTALAAETIDKKVVLQSPDGELWYEEIDNAGVVTYTKIA